MKRPKVSVLLTSYNHAKFIRESIDSILAQTFDDFELIIADDCSTDDSWSIIQSYNDPRIRSIRSPKNRRTAFIFEVIQSCHGQYFALIHSDDIWMPEKLEKQVNFIEANSQYAAVFTHVEGIDETGKKLLTNNVSNAFNQKNKNRYGWLRHLFFCGNGLCHPSVLMSTDYAKQLYTQYGPTLVNDYRGWVRTCMQHEIYVLQTPLTCLRWYPDSDSGPNPLTQSQLEVEFFKIIECYYGIKELKTWIAIFPELRPFVIDGECVPLYAFAQLCVGQTNRPYVVYTGLQLLLSLLEATKTRQDIERLYGFTSIQMREQIRKFDIFSHATRYVNYQALLTTPKELEQKFLELANMGKLLRLENKQLHSIINRLEKEKMVLLEKQKELEQCTVCFPSKVNTPLFICPMCCQEHDGYLPLWKELKDAMDAHGFDPIPLDFEFYNRKSLSCPKCGGLDRERICAEYLLRRLGAGFSSSTFRFLEFAPNPSFSKFFRKNFAVQHETADLLRPDVDHTLDMTNMPEIASESIDAWISLHMLEHIPDDTAALMELRRILKPGGFGMIIVPLSLALDSTDEDFTASVEERWRRFGQDDHIRTYAKEDFMMRIRNAGFILHELDKIWFGEDSFRNAGLPDKAVLYVVEKLISPI